MKHISAYRLNKIFLIAFVVMAGWCHGQVISFAVCSNSFSINAKRIFCDSTENIKKTYYITLYSDTVILHEVLMAEKVPEECYYRKTSMCLKDIKKVNRQNDEVVLFQKEKKADDHYKIKRSDYRCSTTKQGTSPLFSAKFATEAEAKRFEKLVNERK